MEQVKSTILEGLNSEQKAAVSCVEGPVLIVAGAGSGKTRVLTSRIAYILEKGGCPERILALTFTKKAASEMKERIALMVGEKRARKVYMGTFHSIFIRFLRDYSEFLAYPKTFTIYDTSDSISLIKTCLKELQLDDKVYKPKDVLSRISMAKNNLVTAEAYSNNSIAVANDYKAKKPRICDIYKLYSKKCKESGVMDFDDILLNMNILLRDNHDALQEISKRFDYIMVDEYQDTNFAQYIILKKLSATHKNICVVGDDSQSIYAFRGAKIENILNFKKDYPNLHIFRLEQNYRSTRNIVDAANSVIEKNSARIPKKCYSEGDQGEKIKLIKAYTELEEASLISTSIIAGISRDHAEYRDFAILYRTNSQSRVFEEALRKRNIPYMIYSGNSFFDRAEVKDVMAYFKLVVNVNDDESFKRIVNRPTRGIGATSVAALVAAAHNEQTTLFKAAYSENLATYGLKNAAIVKIREFCDMISRLAVEVVRTDAFTVAEKIMTETGIYQLYKSDLSVEGQAKTSNVEELLNSVKMYIDEKNAEYLEDMQAEEQLEDISDVDSIDLPLVYLGDFLENISLLSAVDVEGEDDNNRVALMTIHSSKGLEFPYVSIVGMEENIFPSGGSLLSESEVEEERRLFYVGMTRAKKLLQLSFADSRTRNGKYETNYPSRFVFEINRKYIENPELITRKKAVEMGTSSGTLRQSLSPMSSRQQFSSTNRTPMSSRQPFSSVNRPPASRPAVADEAFIPSPIAALHEGQRVEHNRFGFGKIVKMEGDGENLKAIINFDSYGTKILMLKYAKIRVAEG